MRLFVYEYTCATSANTGSLGSEGRAMLLALVQDLVRVHGVEVATLIHESAANLLRSLQSLPVSIRTIASSGEEYTFRNLVQPADGVLVIAPEFEDILLTRCRWVEEVGGRLYGPSSEAVGLTGDKLRLAEHWRRHQVPTPRCQGVDSRTADWPAVLKPRYGAGSQSTFLIQDEVQLAVCRRKAETEGWRGELILQPFVPGQACSVSFLIGPAGCVALPPFCQHMSQDGCFRYLGGSAPLPPDLAARAEGLGRRAVNAVRGLSGYVGVDLILGDAEDGTEDTAIEINPRLTTSYIGLRELARFNLAEAMLRVVQGEAVTEWSWHAGPVRFTVR
jgi:predicted ATP-grasp superfamily ATP-dependent carboligase